MKRRASVDLNNDPFDAEIQRLGLFQKPDERRSSSRGEPSRRRLGQMTAADLLDKDLPEVRYIIPGYIAEGLTLLGGKPKLGKSWLILGCAIAVATGGYALGSVPVDEGDVLYLALEDNERRLQSRLNQLLPTGTRPERLYIDTTCQRLDGGLLDDLRTWVTSVTNPRLVIVDVLNKICPAQKNNEGIYDYDVRSLEGLQSLAAEYGIAIIVVHHTRKAEAEDPFDCLSGSTGLSGTADATLVLARDSQGVTLYGRGRDIEEIETALSFDRSSGHWMILGAVADVRRSDERTTILQSLKEASEPMSPRDIADDTGMPYQNIRQFLVRMSKAGEVIKVQRGFYCHPDTPVTTITKSQTARRRDYTQASEGADDE
jgi:hypothetical protein